MPHREVPSSWLLQPRGGRASRRAIALLMTLVTSVALGLIVSQMQTTTAVEREQVIRHLKERACRRALDSLPGLARQMLTEAAADFRVDSLDEDWAQQKYFDIGDVRVEVTIEDCARRYDLRSLLVEDSARLETNKASFIAFAVACGVDQALAGRLADAIMQEAAARRVEDQAYIEQLASSDQQQQQQQQQQQPQPTRPKTEDLIPVWLEDFVSLPDLSESDRRAIKNAQTVRDDALTGEKVTVRFMDQLTMWRNGRPNVNTASREVLLYDVAALKDRPDVVDEILRMRAENPFSSVAQLGTVVGLSRDEARQVSTSVRVNSTRFRVTAVATLRDAKAAGRLRPATMTLIIERRTRVKFNVLWRQCNV